MGIRGKSEKQENSLSKVLLLVAEDGEDFYDVQTKVCHKIMETMMEADGWGGDFRCSYEQDRLYQFEWIWSFNGARLVAFVLAKDVGKFIRESKKLVEDYGFDPLSGVGGEYFTEVFVYSPDNIPIPELDKLTSKEVSTILVTTEKVLEHI